MFDYPKVDLIALLRQSTTRVFEPTMVIGFQTPRHAAEVKALRAAPGRI